SIRSATCPSAEPTATATPESRIIRADHEPAPSLSAAVRAGLHGRAAAGAAAYDGTAAPRSGQRSARSGMGGAVYDPGPGAALGRSDRHDRRAIAGRADAACR